jgi:hypothetical protein
MENSRLKLQMTPKEQEGYSSHFLAVFIFMEESKLH